MFRIIIIISYTIEHPVSDPLLHPLFFTQIQLPLTLFFPTQNMCPISYHGHGPLNNDMNSPLQWTSYGNTITNMCRISYNENGALNSDQHSLLHWTGDGNTIANIPNPLPEVEYIQYFKCYNVGDIYTLSEHEMPSNSSTHPSPTDSSCSKCNGRGCSRCF